MNTALEVFGVSGPMLALLTAAAFGSFVVSSTIGIGGAMLLLPALLVELPAAEAVALVSPVMLLNNAFKAAVFRRFVDVRAAAWASVTAIPAAVAGAAFASEINERQLRAGIGALIVVALVVTRISGWTLKVSLRQLAAWGAGIGVVSGLCGAAGAPTGLAMRGYGLDKERFVGTIALFAMGLQVGKIPAYVVTGTLPAERWPLALLLGGAALLAVGVGRALLRRIDVRRFRAVVDATLFALAVWLIAGAALG